MPFEKQDRDLLSRARRGDRSAFSALIARRYPLLLRACQRALSDADLARDAAQEAVLIAMLGLDRLRDDERFGAWLIGIGLNVCRAMVKPRERGSKSLQSLIDEGRFWEPAAPGPGPERQAENADFAVRVRAAIASLPAGQREAVTLFYLAGLTHAEIAEELGTQPSAVKTRLHKARVSLRAPLTELWKEYFVVPSQTEHMVPMRVVDVRRTARAEPEHVSHIVFLDEVDGDRRMPIWIGPGEATALAVILEGVALPRPLVYQFTAALLRAAGGQLREVRIVELTDETFFAQAVLRDGTSIDARPSDALLTARHRRGSAHLRHDRDPGTGRHAPSTNRRPARRSRPSPCRRPRDGQRDETSLRGSSRRRRGLVDR